MRWRSIAYHTETLHPGQCALCRALARLSSGRAARLAWDLVSSCMELVVGLPMPSMLVLVLGRLQVDEEQRQKHFDDHGNELSPRLNTGAALIDEDDLFYHAIGVRC